ncbi:MAG: DNA recombination protein RmuC [Eubacteriales bacterium]|nr:DNA recombination protein RmuC [Eubacteriales bacterium]
MQELMGSPLTQLLLGMLALMLVIIIVLAVLLARLRSGQARSIAGLQNGISDGLAHMEDDLLAQGAAQREELAQNLNRTNDNLLNMVNSIMKMQGDQVNALLKQNYDNAQIFDQRQQAMQRITEESLRRMENAAQNSDARSNALLRQNEERMEALRKTMDESLRRLSTDNAQKLEEMRKTVDEKLHDTLEKRLNESFAQVSKRLEQVYQSLGEMHSLASGVGDLKRMLGNVKTRGVWGEVQLGALLEQALTTSQYQRNVAVAPGTQERVEYAVCLPGHNGGAPVYLPIDSKFPQEDYVRLTEASQNGDAPATEAAQKALMNAVRIEAKRIGKYIAPPHTTDFAVMFLPLEGLYAEVMRHADVVESIQREQRILISGPSTLLALLNSLQMGFRTLAIEQRSAEVWKLLGAVKSDFGSFAQVLQRTQEKLKQATDSIDTAFVKTRTIERRLKNVEALEADKESPALEEGEP